MSEASVRALLRRRLKDLHAKSIENRCEKGTPDMVYIYGWIELKVKSGWPKDGGPLAITHYTIQQRLWLKNHWRHGGRSFLGLVVNKEWLLWAGCDAMPVGYLTREELYQTCLFHSPKWDEKAFRAIITAERPALDRLRQQRGLCELVEKLSARYIASSTKRREKTTSASALKSSVVGTLIDTKLREEQGIPFIKHLPNMDLMPSLGESLLGAQALKEHKNLKG